MTAQEASPCQLSITVPIFNEAGNIELLCQKIQSALSSTSYSWELILINDGSTDGSTELLDILASSNPNIRVLHLARNFGQTSAMMAGFDHAKGNIIIPMDGDLQNDPADIPRLLTRLDDGYDVVSGWRRHRKDAEMRRNLPSRMANKLISKLSGVPLHDYGCSLKAYRRSVLQGVKLYGEMHRFVPIYASWNGAKVTEIEVSHHPRTSGQSKYGLERIFKVVLDLLVVKFLYRYASKPMYVFGGFGMLAIVAGFCSGLWAIGLKFFADKSFVETPLPLLTVFLAVTGIMSILMGLQAEILNRTYHESQSKPIYRISRITQNIDSQAT